MKLMSHRVFVKAIFIMVSLYLVMGDSVRANFSVLDHPILFVHGIASSSITWGAIACNPDRTECNDGDGNVLGGKTTVLRYDTESTIEKFAKHFRLATEVVITPDGNIDQNAGINHNFLEVFNAGDGTGNELISPSGGLADQLLNRISDVLTEYYGNLWFTDATAKLTLIAHSKGGIVIRQMIRVNREPGLDNPVNHIDKVITIGTPHNGSEWAEPVSEIKHPFVRKTKDKGVSFAFDLLRPVEICFGIFGCKTFDPLSKQRDMLNQIIASESELGKKQPDSLIEQLKDNAYPRYPMNGRDIPFVSVVTRMPPEKLGERMFDAATQIDKAFTDLCSLESVTCDHSNHATKISRAQCSDIKDSLCITVSFPPLPPVTLCEFSIARKNICQAANDADAWSKESDFVVTTSSQNLETVYGARLCHRSIFAVDIPHASGILSEEFLGQTSQFDLLLQALEAPNCLSLSPMRGLLLMEPVISTGDFNLDGCVDLADLTGEMLPAIRNGLSDSKFDLNGDRKVNIADARKLVTLFTNPRGAPCSQ